MTAPGGQGPGAWRSLLAAASEEWRTTPFYQLMLAAPEPDRVQAWGEDRRVGDPARGREILAGRWRIADERLPGEHPIPWAAPPPSPHFSARLHGFSWLRDVAAVGPEAQPAIAALIQSWAAGFGAWHPLAWAPELTAQRVFAWLCWGRPGFEGGDVETRPALLRSLGRQVRHLQLSAGELRDGAIIKGGAALVLAAGAGAGERERLLAQGLAILQRACSEDLTSDGLHLSRSPEATFEALADFAAADAALARMGETTPEPLRTAMLRMGDMVRYLSLGDGGLASFNGGGTGRPASIARVLQELEAGRQYRIAPASGFFRLAAGDAALVMDGGEPPPAAFGHRAHAGCLSFEMSCGPDRLIVNVGSDLELSPEWRAAGRATNGHSTLILNDTLSAPFEGTRAGSRPVGPLGVSAKRSDDEDGARVEARHDGYRAEFGLVHARTLFLDVKGERVIGLDQLFRPAAERRAPEGLRPGYAIRFHLHPRVLIDQRGPREIRLETPRGAHWSLRTDAEGVAVEESVYLAAGGAPTRTAQIVLRGAAEPALSGDQKPNRVIWSLTRIDRPT